MVCNKETNDSEEIGTEEIGMVSRRTFFERIGKWSKIVIGATVLGSALLNSANKANAAGAAWANRAGGVGAWANHGGGGAAWVNKAGGSAAWANRGAAWANRGGSWINRY